MASRLSRALSLLLLATVGVTGPLGCVTLAEKRQLEQDLGSLQAQLEVLRKRLESQTEERNETSSQGQQSLAEVKVSVDEMRTDLGKINSEIDANKHAQEEGQKTSKKVFDDIELRFRDLEGRLAEMAKRVESDSRASQSEPSGKSKKAESASAKETSKAPTVRSEREEYDSIVDPLQKKTVSKLSGDELDKTERELLQFMKNYPKSKYKPSAHFWLGEIYFGRKDFKRAILEYDEVVTADSKHQKAPAARLKQGLCFVALGKNDDAKTFFQEVITRYPNSKEAKTAKSKLGEKS